MKWYAGGIAEAVAASKTKGAIFVIYIEGKDEKSQHISTLLELPDVESMLGGDNFVAIKVEADSVPHQQFSALYKQTPVPSIYFIGKNGSPLKIVTEASDSGTLITQLDDVLVKSGINTSNSAVSQSFIDTEQSSSAKPDNVVCENGVCTIKKDTQPSAPSTSTEGEGSAPTTEEKIEKAKQLLEAKRLEKEKEEKETERLKEIERRKVGQEVQKMKKWQEDQELKQLMEEREKEKKQEREARERVLAQIAQDKADRAARFQPVASSTPTLKEQEATPGPSVNRSDPRTAVLQFKLPDGSTKTQDFASTDKLQSVLNYLKSELKLPLNKFTLSTTFPRRQFAEKDYNDTLTDLNLTPNAVILVLPINNGTVSTNTGQGGLFGFVWTLLTPLLGILNFIKAFLGFGSPGTAGGDGSAPSTSGGYSGGSSKQEPPSPPKKLSDPTTVKKQGNIRRLGDLKKDDDDNNTWNGNSTQQM
ncbi:UBX domain-containing protein 4-like isoform X2 [Rhynchophorus ferrugineus]|uniref:UBX domain-containing protein 4-like isoform X2 n=1 Tax=Rhynchophorus ferrugineus TaxID=354439 RepID=UPI003FCE4AEE